MLVGECIKKITRYIERKPMEKDIFCSKYLTVCSIIIALACYVSAGMEYEGYVCKPYINVTQNNENGAELFISLKKKELYRHRSNYDFTCLYEFSFSTDLTAIKISVSRYDPGNSSVQLPCSSKIIKINLFLQRYGKSVKELNCVETVETREWIILWPWKDVFMKIQTYYNDFITQNVTESAIELKVEPVYTYINDHMPYRQRWKQVDLPFARDWVTVGIPQYCLGKYYYDVVYSGVIYPYQAKSKVRFRIEEKSLCIKTRRQSWNMIENPFNYKCPWRITLAVRGRYFITLRCEDIKRYWCLPESWFEDPNAFVEIRFGETDGTTYGKYTITLASNTSVHDKCPLTTTTRPTTTKVYDNSYNNDKSDYEYDRGYTSSTAAIIAPVVGLVVFICALICCASYVRSKRTNEQNCRGNFSRLHLEHAPTETGEAARNPAYRAHDAIRGPPITATDNSSAPPNYYGVMATSASETLPLPNYSELTHPSGPVPSAPPPSYEDALEMIQTSGDKNTEANISLANGDTTTVSTSTS